MAGLARFGLIHDLTAGDAGRLLREHVLPQRRWLAGAAFCMALYAGATAGQAWIMEPMLDHVFLQRDHAMLLLVPVAIVVLALVKGGAGYGQVVMMAHIGQRAIAALHQRLFDHLVQADLGNVVGAGPGPLLSRMT
jgi:subfamily B ATP-binding cassette protein MsbA